MIRRKVNEWEKKKNSKRKVSKKILTTATATLALCSTLTFSQVGFVFAKSNSLAVPKKANGPISPNSTKSTKLPKGLTTNKVVDIQTQWKQLGPSPISEYGDNGKLRMDSGRVSSIAIAQSKNSKTVYVGAANGGVWSSNNEGKTWTPLTDDQASLATGSVTVDPNNPDVLYIGTGEQHFSADSRYGRGILKSTNGGKTWTTLGVDTFGGVHIGKVAVDPFNSSNVWVAADNGLYKSNDGGVTWERMWGEDMWRWGHVEQPTDVYLSKNNPGLIYMSVQGGGLFRSTDGGVNFDLLGTNTDGTGLPNWSILVTDPGYLNMYDASLAVVEGGKGKPDTIYTSYADQGGNLMGMFMSKDSGDTWSKMQNVPEYFDSNYSYVGEFDPQEEYGQGWYDNVIAVDPTDPNHIIAGGITLIESYDGGKTWKTLDIFFNATNDMINTHPDQHAITFDSDGNAFVGNDGGVFEESKDGKWHNLNSNLNTVTFYPGLSAINGGNLLMGGAQDNGTSIFTGQSNWIETLGGDGGYTYIDPSNPNFMMAESQFGNIVKSSDGGKTWNNSMPAYMDPKYANDEESMGDYYSPFVTPFIARPLDNGSHEVLVGADLVYKSTDNGDHYQVISPYLGTISTIAQSKTNPNVIYVGTTYGQVWVSYSGGGTLYSDWHSITPFAQTTDFNNYPDPAGQVASISINPTNEKDITVTYASTGYYNPWTNNHVFWCGNTSKETLDWVNVSKNLPSAFAPSSTYLGDSIVVGTEQGVYIAKPGSDDWSKIGTNLPNAPVTSLIYAGDGKLIAGTYGRGAFRLELGAAAKHIAGLK